MLLSARHTARWGNKERIKTVISEGGLCVMNDAVRKQMRRGVLGNNSYIYNCHISEINDQSINRKQSRMAHTQNSNSNSLD